MSASNLSTDTFVTEDTKKQKRPVIFAGSIYYRHIIESLKLCQASMLMRNFEQWTVLLLDLDSKMSQWYFFDEKEDDVNKIAENEKKADELKKTIETKLTEILTRIFNNSKIDRNFQLYMLKNLLHVQKDIMSASQSLFMGVSEKDSNEFEEDGEDGG